jgi:hypothetical protein
LVVCVCERKQLFAKTKSHLDAINLPLFPFQPNPKSYWNLQPWETAVVVLEAGSSALDPKRGDNTIQDHQPLPCFFWFEVSKGKLPRREVNPPTMIAVTQKDIFGSLTEGLLSCTSEELRQPVVVSAPIEKTWN